MLESAAGALVKWMGECVKNGAATTMAEVEDMGCEVYDLVLKPDDIRAMTRAVIEALMEPTPEMKQALSDAVFDESGRPSDWFGFDEAAVIRAMLQSILQSKEEGEGR